MIFDGPRSQSTHLHNNGPSEKQADMSSVRTADALQRRLAAEPPVDPKPSDRDRPPVCRDRRRPILRKFLVCLIVAAVTVAWVALPSRLVRADESAGTARIQDDSADRSNRNFRDPGPPEVAALPAAELPEAHAYSRVTFHGPPKPLAKGAVTHDWTSFLGPTHNGVSTEKPLLDRWPADGPKAVWEMSKGNSYASPAIQGNVLVFTHRIGDEVLIECLHAVTGAQFWQIKYPSQYQDRYGYDDGPRASPVIDGDRVYIYSAEGRLFCLQLQTGKIHWQRNLSKEFQVPQDFFGSVPTPLIDDNRLIMNIGAPGGPCVIALDKHTGKMLWGAGDEWGPSYSSPVPATVHGQKRVFVFAGGESRPPTGGLLCINPTDGKVDFTFPWRSKSYESVNASCPVIFDNRVLISATYRAGSALLEIDQQFQQKTAWTTREVGTHWNTAIYKDGYLYAFDGRNEPDASLVCVDAKTGKVVWREVPEWNETITLNGQEQKLLLSTYRGTLLHVDGRFLCVGEFGHLLWLDLSPRGYKELQRTWLFAGRHTWALPVLSHGLLYVSQNARDVINRTQPRLICYDLRAAGPE